MPQRTTVDFQMPRSKRLARIMPKASKRRDSYRAGQRAAKGRRFAVWETVFQSRINRNAGFWDVLKEKNLPYKGKGMKKVRKIIKRVAAAALAAAGAAGLTGCGSVTSGKRIIRVSHAQSETHPEHIGLLAFKEYVEERLGDKYEVQIFPNEILGSAQKAS